MLKRLSTQKCLKEIGRLFPTCSSAACSPEDLEAWAEAAAPLLPPLLSRLSARQIGVRRRYVFPFDLSKQLVPYIDQSSY